MSVLIFDRMVANNELPGRISSFAKTVACCQPRLLFGICHSFVFPYQWILHPLSKYARKQEAKLETIFPAAVLANLSSVLSRVGNDRRH